MSGTSGFGEGASAVGGNILGALAMAESVRHGGLLDAFSKRAQALQDPAIRDAISQSPFLAGVFGVGGGERQPQQAPSAFAADQGPAVPGGPTRFAANLPALSPYTTAQLQTPVLTNQLLQSRLAGMPAQQLLNMAKTQFYANNAAVMQAGGVPGLEPTGFNVTSGTTYGRPKPPSNFTEGMGWLNSPQGRALAASMGINIGGGPTPSPTPIRGPARAPTARGAAPTPATGLPALTSPTAAPTGAPATPPAATPPSIPGLQPLGVDQSIPPPPRVAYPPGTQPPPGMGLPAGELTPTAPGPLPSQPAGWSQQPSMDPSLGDRITQSIHAGPLSWSKSTGTNVPAAHAYIIDELTARTGQAPSSQAVRNAIEVARQQSKIADRQIQGLTGEEVSTMSNLLSVAHGVETLQNNDQWSAYAGTAPYYTSALRADDPEFTGARHQRGFQPVLAATRMFGFALGGRNLTGTELGVVLNLLPTGTEWGGANAYYGKLTQTSDWLATAMSTYLDNAPARLGATTRQELTRLIGVMRRYGTPDEYSQPQQPQ